MNYIEIDGTKSISRLKFDKLPLFPMAVQKTASYNVGRDEAITYDLEEYDDITLNLTAYLLGGRGIEEIYSWLHGAKTLTLSTQPDLYAKIRAVGRIEPDRTGWSAHKIVIPFTLSPFKYAVDNPETELENGGYVYNRGTIYSRPIWRLYNVQSPVYLNVNGEQLEINCEGGETVVIDTQRMVVYSGVDVILNKTSGNLPLLNTAMNQISWTGGVDRVTLQKNERWL